MSEKNLNADVIVKWVKFAKDEVFRNCGNEIVTIAESFLLIFSDYLKELLAKSGLDELSPKDERKLTDALERSITLDVNVKLLEILLKKE